MMAALFDLAPKERWTGSRALVPLSSSTCPTCGAGLHVVTTEQPALFLHGGFGATAAQVVRWCASCSWSLKAATEERRPDRGAA